MPEPVDRIMEDLRWEVQKYVLVQDQDLETVGDPATLSRLRQTQWVNSHVPIGWPVMPRNLVRKVTAYLKKVTRRLLRWYINPLVDQQNQYNAAATNIIADQQHQIRRLQDAAQDLQEQVDEVRQSYSALRREVTALRERLHDN